MRSLILSAMLGMALLFAPGAGLADVGQSLEKCVEGGEAQAKCIADMAEQRARKAALEEAQEAAAEAAREDAAEAARDGAGGP